MGQCRSRRITSHSRLGAEQGLIDGSVQPGQEWAKDMGTGEPTSTDPDVYPLRELKPGVEWH